MDIAELRQALDDVFDQALVHHGFTDYMRDYELIVYTSAGPSTGIPPAYRRYLFRYCVEAHVESSVRPDTWRQSLDEHLIDPATQKDLDGYFWGVKWQCLYPGGAVVPDSPRALAWSQALGLDFHEVRFESNSHNVNVVFSDLQVTEVQPGYTPFVVRAD